MTGRVGVPATRLAGRQLDPVLQRACSSRYGAERSGSTTEQREKDRAWQATPRYWLNGDGRRRLVIVESPAKARTIAGYLGPNYIVESSIGHIRDLPGGAGDMPAAQKHLWKTYGIDVDHGFEPVYVVNADKKQQVAKLKAALKNVDELLLATE